MQNRYNRRNRRKYNLKVHIVLVAKRHRRLCKTCYILSCRAKQLEHHCYGDRQGSYPHTFGIRRHRTHLRHHQHHQTANNALALDMV